MLLVQFICMLSHRLFTLRHFLARAPYRFGHAYKSSWSYKTIEDQSAAVEVQRAEVKCSHVVHNRSKQKHKKSKNNEETLPLIPFEQGDEQCKTV